MPDYIFKALFCFLGLFLLAQLGALLRRPMKGVFRFLLQGASGLAGLLTVNTLGSLAGLGLGVNLITCLVSGLLGLPGVGLLYGLRYLVFA